MISRRMAIEGQMLFRFRSFLPLLFILPLAFSMRDFRYLNGSHFLEQCWLWFCFAVSVAGFVVRVTTVGFVPRGTSGRNTMSQRAESLNQTGWYSVCLNQLYIGNFLIGLGFILSNHQVAMALIYTAAFWLYYERIIAAEEEYLCTKFGDAYRDWAARTPIFVPALSQWKSPSMSFCTRTVLRREYSAVLLIGSVFLILNAAETWVAEKRLRVDTSWGVLFAVCVLIFVVLRSLKKYTRLLRVCGR